MHHVTANQLLLAERNRALAVAAAAGPSLTEDLEYGCEAVVRRLRAINPASATTPNLTGFILDTSVIPETYAAMGEDERAVIDKIMAFQAEYLSNPRTATGGESLPFVSSDGFRAAFSMVQASPAGSGALFVQFTFGFTPGAGSTLNLYAIPASAIDMGTQVSFLGSPFVLPPSAVTLLSGVSVASITVGNSYMNAAVAHSLNGSYFILGRVNFGTTNSAYGVTWGAKALTS